MDTKGNGAVPSESGVGVRSAETTDAGITAIHEQRLISRAIRGRWTGEKRWQTEVTSEDLQRRFAESSGKLTLKEQAVLATMKGVQSDNDRARGIAVRNLLTMEAQNQADELKQLPDLHLNIHRMAEDEKKDRLAEIIAGVRKRTEAAQAVPPAASNGHVNGDSQPGTNGSANGHA